MIAFLYDTFFLLPLTLTLAVLLRPFAWAEAGMVQILAAAAVSAVGLLLEKHLKRQGRIWLAGTVAALLLSAVLLQPADGRMDFLRSQFWILRLCALSAACFLLLFLQERFRILRSLLAICGLGLLVFFLFHKTAVERGTVAGILLYGLFTLVDEIQRHSVKEGGTDPRKHLVYLSPFLLLLVSGAVLMKAPDTPYDWSLVKNIARRVEDSFHILEEKLFTKSSWDAPVPRIGFSDRGDFADSMTKADYTAMTMDVKTGADLQMYLAGKRFDSFDGRGWIKNDENSRDLQGFDTLETLTAILDREDILSSEDLMRRSSITLTYEGLHSACIFTPPKTVPGKAVYENRPVLSGGDLSAADGRKSAQEYSVVYYRQNRDHGIFEDMLRTPHTVTEESWETARTACGITDPNQYTYEEYLLYREEIRRSYLPQTLLSERMQKYMDQLLEGADNDYDKLLRIEELLKSFHYTNRPGALPERLQSEADFLDYFIFDKQEGYCSYFATAFVLLARANGIPARYVQGFRVPVRITSRTVVLSSYAHAWPEVYLEGIGWIVFEPTPGLSRYVRWNTKEEAAALEEDADEETADPGNSTAEKEASEEKEDTSAGSFLRWYHIVIPVAAGILLATTLFALDRLVRRTRFRKMDARKKAIWLCHRNLELLRRLKMPRTENETLEEFAKRAGSRFGEEELAFCNICEGVLYGDRVPGEQELELLLENYRLLRCHAAPLRVLLAGKRGIDKNSVK